MHAIHDERSSKTAVNPRVEKQNLLQKKKGLPYGRG
jgi:hypothetical protein